MVKANELRVGNWIADHEAGGYFQIESIYKNAIGAYRASYRNGSIDCTIDALEEIPLTEEWLVKFGFEKNKNKVDIYEIGRLRIWIGSNGRCLAYLIEEDTTFGHYIPVPIEYVHQLQNLYFSLTGEELEIKRGNNE